MLVIPMWYQLYFQTPKRSSILCSTVQEFFYSPHTKKWWTYTGSVRDGYKIHTPYVENGIDSRAGLIRSAREIRDNYASVFWLRPKYGYRCYLSALVVDASPSSGVLFCETTMRAQPDDHTWIPELPSKLTKSMRMRFEGPSMRRFCKKYRAPNGINRGFMLLSKRTYRKKDARNIYCMDYLTQVGDIIAWKRLIYIRKKHSRKYFHEYSTCLPLYDVKNHQIAQIDYPQNCDNGLVDVTDKDRVDAIFKYGVDDALTAPDPVAIKLLLKEYLA